MLSFVLLFISVSGFYSYKLFTPKIEKRDLTEASWKVRYGQSQLITNTLWVNWVVKTKQFYKPSEKKPYKIPEDLTEYFPENQLWLYENISPTDQLEDAGRRYIADYYQNNPNSGIVGLNLSFIAKYPGIFMQKLILSPIFFISMAANGTLVKLLYNLIFLTLGIAGMFLFKDANFRVYILTIVAVVLGYSSLYWLTHSIDRYSLPILPWVITWSGVSILRLYNLLNKKSLAG